MFNLNFIEMKKLTYLLVLMFSLVLVTSCEKDETTEQTSGEKYPEYMGYWQNDKTTVGGEIWKSWSQWEFDIHDIKAERYDKVGNELNSIYDSWKIDGDVISFYRDGYGDKKYTIQSAPINNIMILRGFVTMNGKPMIFYLSKRDA